MPRIILVISLVMITCRSLVAGSIPPYDHVVVVIEENRGYSDIFGSSGPSSAPYLNSLATTGAIFTNSHTVSRPSQPNYLQLFSGSDQGIHDNNIHPRIAANSPTSSNLASELALRGKTFVGYSEDLPYDGYTWNGVGDPSGSGVVGTGDNGGFGAPLDTGGYGYARKHNPMDQFANILSVPSDPMSSSAAVSKTFAAFPGDFHQLPTVAFVVPNQLNDMHGDGSVSDSGTLIPRGDAWLNTNFSSYGDWAQLHNSLLIVTWDEDNLSYNTDSHIPTLFVGAHVQPGQYAEYITHENVLRTLEEMSGTGYSNDAANVAPITDAFTPVPEPSSFGLALIGLAATLIGAFRAKDRTARPGRAPKHGQWPTDE